MTKHSLGDKLSMINELSHSKVETASGGRTRAIIPAGQRANTFRRVLHAREGCYNEANTFSVVQQCTKSMQIDEQREC